MRVSLFSCFTAMWSFFMVHFWGAPMVFYKGFVDLFSGIFCFGILVDEVSLSFSGIVLMVVFFVYNYSLGYMGGDTTSNKFYVVLSVFVGSMVILVFSADLISMFLAWEGLGVSSFLLVVYYNNHSSAASGIITILSNRLGDVCFLLGLGSMFGMGEVSFLFSEACGLGLFFFACVSKSAQWPLCGWLPAAMAAPTPVSALVHSSTLVTAGAYLLFRFEGVELGTMESFILVPVITMFLASLSAFVSYDMKRMVAMSTLSHIAFICWAILSGYQSLAFFHLLSHALFKSLLFLCAGVLIQEAGHSQDIRLMGGLMNSHPIVGAGLLYSSVSMMGVPLLSGYDSKESVAGGLLLSQVQSEELAYLLGVLTLVFSGGYSARVLVLLMMGSYSTVTITSGVTSYKMIFPVIFLMLLGSILGKWMCFYSCVGLGVPGFMSLSWIFFLTVGLLVGESVLSGGYNEAWYEVGELGTASSFMSHSSLEYSLMVSDMVEMGWLEEFGGEGLFSMTSSVSKSLTKFEW